MLVYIAQANPVVGDVKGNFENLRQIVHENSKANLIVFPELFLSGYPPQDLLLKGDFLNIIQDSLRLIQEFSQDYPNTALVVGTPWPQDGQLFNSAVVIQNGSILGLQHKRKLSKFRLFDETRYFSPGVKLATIQLEEYTVGLALGLEFDLSQAQDLKSAGANLLINLSAIPFQVGEEERIEKLKAIGERVGLPLINVGQVGANDALIFSGKSFAIDKMGRQIEAVSSFEASGVLVDLNLPGKGAQEVEEDETAQIFNALVLGVRDYVRKSGMRRTIIGLSGGLDSAVSAVIAAKALGPENVWGITQPGPYSSASSVEDARILAENLQIKFDVLPINNLYEATLSTLDTHFAGTEMNVAEENIQARLRGNLLMSLSNKFGGLVLTNSNKSELAVGYCTLYGDMSGGLAVLADVYKTQVYQLAYYINRESEIIPWNTIEKPPSAELRPNQRDDETLPPYEILDAIIKAYIDEGLSPSEIIKQGYAEEIVRWVTRTTENNEYKRRQAALILRVTTPILGEDRKMPLAAVKGV